MEVEGVSTGVGACTETSMSGDNRSSEEEWSGSGIGEGANRFFTSANVSIGSN